MSAEEHRAHARSPESLLMAVDKRVVLVAVIMGSFVVGIDATVVNVALPDISSDLGGGLLGQQWIVTAYLLVLGAFMLLGGSLGDHFGERRVFAAGVIGFGLGSICCAVAPTIEVLVVARALQGLAGALLTPAALAVIVAVYPRDERGGAFGAWAAWSGVASVLGPLAGGEILAVASWRWIFLVNIPFVLATLTLVPRIPQRPPSGTTALDLRGAGLAALGLAGPVLGLIEQPRHGWSSVLVAPPIAGGLVLLALFGWWERRAPAPMLPLRLFRARNFAWGNLETFLLYGGLGAFFLFLVLFLQQVAGYSPLQSGLATLPTTLISLALTSRFGRLADRHGPRLLMTCGPLVCAAGLLLLWRLGARFDYARDLLPAILLFSLGLSMTIAPLTAAVLSDADEHDAGVASAVNNTVARIAGLLATATVGAAVASQFGASLERQLPRTRGPELQSFAAQAERRSLGVPSTTGLTMPVAARARAAAVEASEDAFHVGMGVVTVLVAGAGLVGLAGIRNSERVGEAQRQDTAMHAPA